mmetsp:Transcript_61033/g.145426  ORF Transcript_61033/g.145426 Transcript_61033/m.145426 type:complete len:137 (+) Transcript_61033:68-478(+)
MCPGIPDSQRFSVANGPPPLPRLERAQDGKSGEATPMGLSCPGGDVQQYLFVGGISKRADVDSSDMQGSEGTPKHSMCYGFSISHQDDAEDFPMRDMLARQWVHAWLDHCAMNGVLTQATRGTALVACVSPPVEDI